MINILLVLFGKLLSSLFRLFNLGNGTTWPGHIALKVNQDFLQQMLAHSRVKTIFIAGTNGKTTTAKLIRTALEEAGKTVLQNESGANLTNGIASTLLLHATILGKLNYDYAIFEVDENTLPKLLKEIKPSYVVLLNLFRDQLDRYGEVNSINQKWKKEIEKLTDATTLILNADDAQIAHLAKGTEAKVVYFGLQDAQFGTTGLQHAADSVYCPHCGEKLVFDAVAFSHLGKWHCEKCSFKRPLIEAPQFIVYPVPGLYNKYNALAAAVTLRQNELTDQQINDAFTDFVPAFGRQEIITYQNKNLQIFLSKNPTSFNQSYITIKELGGQTMLLILNDRIPDGRDISWIWDTDLPDIENFKHILITGDRVYDMALRLQYELGIKNYQEKVQTFEDLNDAIETGVKLVDAQETFYILPTYSAMLDARKIITGKKIL